MHEKATRHQSASMHFNENTDLDKVGAKGGNSNGHLSANIQHVTHL